ncbi:germination protein YpeB [Halobacillus litoralis]|uniref:Germination protein YpeB n=1 Tax=Halobacillus litoralis TaxID=45668 RepID=A0A845DPA1_9BACI|nr:MULTISPECIES: germination protein YpeB [Halobacillus]MYL19441.1 germination protein YpeB [Halobacillus litoralis]MYL28587.1 germination protein YpeB [Halobacillus halophilus]
MIRWSLVVVLSIAVVGLGVWGYQENQDKNAVLIQAENSYQRAFHDLTYNIDLLHDKIGSSLAMNSKQSLSPQLADIWKISSEANTDVGQLPLTLLPFNKTEEFLYDIGDFAYRTAVRDLEKKPLSDEEIKLLEELHAKSGEIEEELRKVQNEVLSDNLRWMDVELALATNDEVGDNTIVNGFKTVEKSMDSFESSVTEVGFGSSGPEKDYRDLQGENLTKAEARKQASKWLEKVDTEKLTLTKSGKGADVPTYTASFQEGDKNGYIDLTEKGGHPLTIMISREVNDPQISLYEASEKAKEYVGGLDIDNLELVESNQYDKMGVFRFLYTKNDVRFFPDTVVVKVALDNGEILGLSARDYYDYHIDQDLNEPEISLEEARSKVNPNVDIQEHHLSVIENDLKEQVLCYEFLTTMESTTYRIFINASTGEEEKVETLKKAEMKFNQEI